MNAPQFCSSAAGPPTNQPPARKTWWSSRELLSACVACLQQGVGSVSVAQIGQAALAGCHAVWVPCCVVVDGALEQESHRQPRLGQVWSRRIPHAVAEGLRTAAGGWEGRSRVEHQVPEASFLDGHLRTRPRRLGNGGPG